MRIPFYDLTRVNAPVRQQLLQKTEEILLSNEYILGKEVSEFEKNFAAFCETQFCAGVGNGLDALFLSLKVLNIGAGDEVIVPAHTFIATWLAVTRTKATIVPVDVRQETCNINPDLIYAAITSRTKAIVPVHLYGQVCEMDSIMKLAHEHNLYVVEDFAQAQGALYNGRPAGSFGNVNATSFYPSKNLGAFGDAGAVTTGSKKIYRHLKILRNYGSEEKYIHQSDGYNTRLDNLQAALLNLKLPHLKSENESRRKIAALYRERLAGIGDLVFQQEVKGGECIYHLFVVRTSQRDTLAKYLNERGVGTAIHYPVAPFNQSVYASLKINSAQFPVAASIAETCLSLPMFGDLQAQEIEYVCQNIKEFYRQQ